MAYQANDLFQLQTELVEAKKAGWLLLAAVVSGVFLYLHHT